LELLRVESLSKTFGGTAALYGSSFSIEEGERVAVIGPNGAGKSTLLNVIGGQLQPTSGLIYLRNKEISALPPHQRLRLGVARSFQLNNLFMNLSVLDNVLLAFQGAKGIHFQMWQSDVPLEQLFLRSGELLKSMNLWERRHVRTTALSYGEQRQMEVALGLASDPKILLLDEPCAGLAATETANLLELIRNLPEDTSVLFCEHDMGMVFSIANQIMVMQHGGTIIQGSPEDVRSNQQVREAYLGGADECFA